MDIPVYRLIDLARLLFFRALLLEAERRRDVSSSTSAHDTLQTARTHRRRAARRGRGVRPTGTPLSAHGFDSRQRAVDLRPMPDLCGQRARRRRLFAFDANGELIEAPTPAGDAPSSRGAVPSLTEIVSSDLLDSPFPERGVRSAKRSAPSLTEIVPSDLLDSPFPERAVRSAKRSAPSAKGAAPSLTEIVPSDLLDSPFPERGVQSPKRSVPSAAWDVHAAVRDVLAPAEDVPSLGRAARSSRGAVPTAAEDVHAAVRDRGDSNEARYAALAKSSAQTADRLLRRVSRHRAKGK